MRTETHEPVFKGIWIPAELWECDDLSPNQIFLWAIISSLGRQDSPCRAGNKWLAMRLKATESSVANAVSFLRSKGYIKDISFDGRHRLILAVIPSKTDTKKEPDFRRQPSPPGEPCPNQEVNTQAAPNIRENKGENKEEDQCSLPLVPSLAPKDASRLSPVSSPHKVFTDMWAKEFESSFGSKYIFQNGKDGSAIKRLLADTKLPPEKLIDVAKKAWASEDRFVQSSSRRDIAGFRSCINIVMSEKRKREPWE